MSQGNVRGTQPPNTTTGKSSSDGAYGSPTAKPTTASEMKDPVRKATQFIQKLKHNNVYSFDRLGIKRRGDSEDPTVNTMPVGTIKYLNKDHQPDTSSELQGRKEQRPRANITQASPENFENMGNINILLRNRQRITPEENENGTTEEIPLVEEYQKSRDVNNAITTATSHSYEHKESSKQLQVKIKPPRPPPPPPSDKVTLLDNHKNPTQMATVEPLIGTEDSPPNHSLQSFCPEEISMIREFPSAEAHLESRDMNNATTSGASHSQEPKENSQQLSEKKKPKVAQRRPPPPPPERVTSRDKYKNVPLMDVGDTSKGTEDITPKQSLQSLSLEENSTTRKFPLAVLHQSMNANNATTSEASHSHKPKDSSQQLPEMAKPRPTLRNPPPLPPPPLHPPEKVTPRDKFMNATQVVIEDNSTGMEDIASKLSLPSCAEEMENSTKRKIPLVEAQQSRDANNASTTGGAHLHEPKESSQKEKPKVPSRAPPPPPPPHPPVRGTSKDKPTNTIPTAKSDTSRTEDGPSKHTIQSSSHGPKESPQHLGKKKPLRPSRTPAKRTTSTEKPVTGTQMVKGGRWTEDSHPKHTLQPPSFDASQVLVLSWDLGHEASNVSSYLMGNQNRDCPCVALSSLKKDSEWTSLVDQSSIVIFYTTPKSQKPLHKMGRYLEYCISKKGAEKVIAVIADANNMEEEWTTKWEENKFPKIQQFQVSQAELGWISRKEMPRKIEEIRKSLIIHAGSPTGRMQMSQPANQTVGFLSWSPKDDSQWLLKLLQPPYFRDMVGDIIYIDVDKNENEKIMEQIFNVPSLILHFTQESFYTFSSQPDSSERLRLYCEKKKIVVVIDDLDGKNSEMTIKELYKKSNMGSMSSDLFMFGKEEKEVEYLTHLTGGEPDNKEAEKKKKLFQDAISRNMKLPDPQGLKLGKVGIFSRSSQTDYEWLEPLLKSADLGVKEVRPVYISNKGYAEFYEELTICDFAILYHTKNRGRVNITNVNESLYDMEIEELSTALGRYKFLVVIDDLQDSSWRTKNRILKFQYSIPKFARNMLLVSEEEKKKGENEGKLLTKLIEIIVSPAVDEEGGRQCQELVKAGVRHPEIIPKTIRIILLELPQQRHLT